MAECDSYPLPGERGRGVGKGTIAIRNVNCEMMVICSCDLILGFRCARVCEPSSAPGGAKVNEKLKIKNEKLW